MRARPLVHELLSLLQTGQIRAVAFFEAVSHEPVPIPREYWLSRGPDKLISLRTNDKRHLKGTYEVELKDIAFEAAKIALRNVESKQDLCYERLARLIGEGDK